ncbi:hypothetical protein FS594_12200 [Rahnella aquatilis]|uniref:hypothetical protein n=1 Tax=Rahnella perminowiae TaxID=2816244 RepID=UPI001F266C57|nr:hypothetical protein [Rahnella perminowiae]MCX2945218.1 hypothetical protein [Rahnella perminowiae]UJD89494.1 hypothetical protein FS594_12200 [Rahnella aquatilis]
MYKLISNIEPAYVRYADKIGSEGVCMGMVLTWLGDVLKSPMGRSAEKCLQKSVFPKDVDEAALQVLFERSARKQTNYTDRSIAYILSGGKEPNLKFLAAYKDKKQRINEVKRHIPGLYYREYPLTYYRDIKGLDVENACSSTKQGVMISVDMHRQKENPHVTAAIRMSESLTYFLDPNYGLYRIDGKEPNKEIEAILYRQYGRFYFSGQIVVSQ